MAVRGRAMPRLCFRRVLRNLSKRYPLNYIEPLRRNRRGWPSVPEQAASALSGSSDPKVEYIPHPTPSEPYWLAEAGEKHAKYTNFRSTEKLPSSAQVVIIGAGLTGLSTAYWLSEYGIMDIVILDVRGVAEGATGRNGGHLWPYTEMPSSNEIEKYGSKAVYKRHEFQFNTVKQMIETIKKHNIDCDFKLTGGMNVALSEEENEGFKQYVRQFDSLGLGNDATTSHVYVSPEDAQKYTTSPKAKGGIACEFAGQVWPAKFVFGLADIVVSRKVNIQTRTLVKQVRRHWSPKEQLEVDTDRGTIFCEKVVYATNGYTSHLLPELRRTIVPTQGQVLTTAPIKMSIPGNTWYDFGYLYLIQRPNGKLILGGCRNKHPKGEIAMIDDSKLEPAVSEALRDFLKTTFPGTESFTVEHEWTGIMGFTPDYLPLIGHLRGNEYIAAGYTGYGMPKCFGAGKAVAEMITGKLKQSDFVPQYNPSRFWPVSKL